MEDKEKHQMQLLKFLKDSGLLFEINRNMLHPQGLALSVICDPDTEDPVKFGPIIDSRDDPEGIRFSEDLCKDGQDKYEKYMIETGFFKQERRQKLLGYVTQYVKEKISAK